MIVSAVTGSSYLGACWLVVKLANVGLEAAGDESVYGSPSLLLLRRRWAGSRHAVCRAKVGRAKLLGCARPCHPSIDGKAQFMAAQSAFVCRVPKFKTGDAPDAASSLCGGVLVLPALTWPSNSTCILQLFHFVQPISLQLKSSALNFPERRHG